MNGFRFFDAPERRYRLLGLTPELMLNVLFSPLRESERVRWLTVEGLPEGTRIEAVVWDDYRRCFLFRLYHGSFDVVPGGEEIPVINPTLTAWEVRVPKTVLDSLTSNVAEGLSWAMRERRSAPSSTTA